MTFEQTPHTYGRSLLSYLLRDTNPTHDPNKHSLNKHSPITHVRDLPGRDPHYAPWPTWILPAAKDWLNEQGIAELYTHQVATANLAWEGNHVVVATGTASGKTLGYHLPIITQLAADPNATALYLSPTKALGADQLRAFTEFLDGAAHMATDPTVSQRLRDSSPAQYDGDTPTETRTWIRDHSRFILTNPDMLHLSILGKHKSWLRLLRNLTYVVIDECHAYRGVFGSNVAIEVRRLLRLAAHYGATPTIILASATTSHPEEAASTLIGMPVTAVTEDGSPQGERTIVLWEPPIIPRLEGENGAPVRRAATKEAATLMADLVTEGARTLAFVRSRRGAEDTALAAQHALIRCGEQGELPLDRATDLAQHIGAYRAGYLAEDRRQLEQDLNDGTLLAAATTNALELGVDIAGVDAVIIAGFPGTVASFWQQSGRAGRRNQGSLVILIGRSDPLDSYLLHHPETLLDKPVEATVTNPANPNLLVPQLWCAAAEMPLRDDEVVAWSARDGVDVEELLGEMQDHGMVRHRKVSAATGAWYPAGYYDSSWQNVSLRGGSADEFSIVCIDDGQLLGTADAARAFAQLHPGAIYLHQGDSYLVTELDLENGIACVTSDVPPWTTYSRANTQIHVERIREERHFGSGASSVTIGLADVTVVRQVKEYERKAETGEVIDVVDVDMPPTELYTQAVYYHVDPLLFHHFGIAEQDVPGALHAAEHAAQIHVERIREERHFGSGASSVTIGLADVTVVRQVKEYERKAETGEVIDVVDVDMPPTELYTQAVYYHVDPLLFHHFGIAEQDVPGALHAAEHAAIGMLPLLVGCDRADIGGLSTPLHEDTGEATVFVYDGYQSGAGYAQRGYREMTTWLRTTRDAIVACSCEDGCPSCIQSPKCGNGNRPLSKSGAVALLGALSSVLGDMPDAAPDQALNPTPSVR